MEGAGPHAAGHWPAESQESAEETRLLAKLRAGDEAAFETLVRTYGGRMLAVTRRFLNNSEDARDAVQDAFISAFRSLDRFEGGSKLSTWLHQIAVNAALMRLRTRKRHPEESIEDLLPSFLEDGHTATPASEWKEPADVLVEREEDRTYVRACIDRLPESYRTILLLRDIEELDTEETARMLGVSTNAVKTRLHRARQALRTLLDSRFGKAGA